MILPPELKLSIADYLEPFAAFNFAITSKEHWSLCSPIVKDHERMFDKQGKMVIPYQEIHWDDLETILMNKRLGWYVRHLQIDEDETLPFDNLSQYDPGLVFEAREEMDHVYDYTEVAEEYRDSSFQDDPTAILVHHLPHLKSIHITSLRCGNSLWPLFECLRLAYQRPGRNPRLAFQYLTTAAVSKNEEDSGCEPDWIQFFMAVPSLQRLIAIDMGGRFSDNEFETPKSNVKELILYGCRFDLETTKAIISNTKALEQFSYVLADPLFFPSVDDADMSVVIRALARHSRHSLEHLVLDSGAYSYSSNADLKMDPIAPASFRRFQKLKTLKCQYSMISPMDENRETFVPQRDLPVSLERLHVDMFWTDGSWEHFTAQLRGIKDHLPALQSMYIDNDTPDDVFQEEGVFREPIPTVEANSLVRDH